MLKGQKYIFYCERSPNETSVYFHSVNYNDTISSNQWSIYVNSQHVEQNREYGRKAREGDREQRISGVREGALVINGNVVV
jgi:hypothetical protein